MEMKAWGHAFFGCDRSVNFLLESPSVVCLWLVWYIRNVMVMDKFDVRVFTTTLLCFNGAEDFIQGFHATNVNERSNNITTDHCASRWNQPHTRVFKINTEVAMEAKNDGWSCRAIIRDAAAMFTAGMANGFRGSRSVLMAKAANNGQRFKVGC